MVCHFQGNLHDLVRGSCHSTAAISTTLVPFCSRQQPLLSTWKRCRAEPLALAQLERLCFSSWVLHLWLKGQPLTTPKLHILKVLVWGKDIPKPKGGYAAHIKHWLLMCNPEVLLVRSISVLYFRYKFVISLSFITIKGVPHSPLTHCSVSYFKKEKRKSSLWNPPIHGDLQIKSLRAHD